MKFVMLTCRVSCLDRLHIHITLAATGIKDPGAVNAIAKVLVLPWAALFLDCHDLQPHLAPVAVVVHPARCCQLDDLLNWGVLQGSRRKSQLKLSLHAWQTTVEEVETSRLTVWSGQEP